MPIARGKHLFPYRTQQLSLSAVTILGPSSPGKIARRRFMLKPSIRGGLFLLVSKCMPLTRRAIFPRKLSIEIVQGFCLLAEPGAPFYVKAFHPWRAFSIGEQMYATDAPSYFPKKIINRNSTGFLPTGRTRGAVLC